MQSDLPKVLHLLQGKPLIQHVLDSLQTASVDDITVVVGYRGDLVIDAVGTRARCVWQHEQLGTGHAVMQAEEIFDGYRGIVIVACGDVPLVKPGTFAGLMEEMNSNRVKAAVLTMVLHDPTGYGRIVKDADGRFMKITEEKDAPAEIRKIREVNTGTYVFDSEILFQGLRRIDTNNAQGEYYLPDALQFVLDKGNRVETLMLDDPVEGSGINTKDELNMLEKYLAKGNRMHAGQ